MGFMGLEVAPPWPPRLVLVLLLGEAFIICADLGGESDVVFLLFDKPAVFLRWADVLPKASFLSRIRPIFSMYRRQARLSLDRADSFTKRAN